MSKKNNKQQSKEEKVFSKDDAYQTLVMVNSWIGNIDAKVSFALAFVGVLIGSIFKEGLPNAFEKIGCVTGICKAEATDILAALMVILLYGASFFAIICFILAITTRVRMQAESVFFFGSINKLQLNEYRNKVNNMSEQKLIEDLEEQIHTNSHICNLKAAYYNNGLKGLIITICFWFICMIFQLI